jgi:predicted ATPase/class 3 adenylate cyclase
MNPDHVGEVMPLMITSALGEWAADRGCPYAVCMATPGDPPVGEVALLFTDVEGSTSLARALGERWGPVHGRHHELLRGAVEAHGGWLDFTEGDAVFATFSDPASAAAAAIAAQRKMRDEPWPELSGALRVRMGLHVGMVERVGGSYVGLEIHRASRVASAAHGGQLLVTEPARVAVAGALELDDLGLHRLKDFPSYEHLYCAVIDGIGAADFPSPRTLGVRPTNLPPVGTLLVGREQELAEVTALVGEHRLTTIIGRGGCGKTTLGLAAAERLLSGFAGGAWWVPLATVETPSLVLATVAAVVRTDPVGRVPLEEALVSRLEAAPTLLVLDNMEHLLDAGPAVQTLLHRLPELRVLATSQIPLGLDHEHVYPLGPMEPTSAYELFVRKAQQVRSDLHLDGAEVDAIHQICAGLDCQPLAVDLAAARLSVLTAAQVRDRLFADVDLLRRPGLDGGLPRHRSLTAEVEWSLGLMGPSCTAVFERMGTFARAASVADLEAVSGPLAGQLLDALDDLVRFALVQPVEEGDGVVRFALPEAVRQVAVRALDRDPDAERWRLAHAEHVRSVLEAARLRHSCSEQEYAAAAHLDADAAVALGWATQAAPVLAADIAGLWSLCLMSDGQAREARELISFVERSSDSTRRARAHAGLSAVKNRKMLGDLTGSVASADSLLPEMQDADPDLVSYLWSYRGKVQAFRGEYDEAVSDCATATALARVAGTDGWGGSLLDEVEVLTQAGRPDEAFARLAEFAVREAQRPQPSMYARYEYNLHGDAERAAGRYGAAIELYIRSLRSSVARADDQQALYDLTGLAAALIGYGSLAGGLEAAGMARAAATEQFGAPTFADHAVGTNRILDAQAGVGTERAGHLEAAGLAVPAGQRVVRAAELVAAAVR